MLLNEKTRAEWRAIAAHHAPNNFFQQERWLELTAELFDLNNIFLEITYHGNELYICLQKKGKEAFAPFIGYGGFISDSTVTPDAIDEIMRVIENRYKIKIKRTKISPGNMLFLKESPHWCTDTTSILPIASTVWQKESNKKVRNAINNAKRAGVVVRPLRKEDFDDFYSIYVDTTKRVGSSYQTPRKLFERLHAHHNCYFAGAFIDNALVAISIFLHQGNVSYYWWNASSTLGSKENANYVVLHSVLEELYTQGYKYLDMGSSHSNGVKKFKQKWGAEDTEFVTLAD